MKLDSDEQRNLLLTMLVQVPVGTTVGDVLTGKVLTALPAAIRELISTIQNAELEGAEDGD